MEPCPGKSFDSQVKKLAKIFVIISGLPNDNLPKETCVGNNCSKAIEAYA